MKTCLVSLISDQTIPNILIILGFKPDHLLFITTQEMEKKGKSQAILNTVQLCGIDYSMKYQKIEVNENSIIDLQNKVGQWYEHVKEDFNFILNITGGTKLMSIAAYDLFKDFGSEMVYIPIPENHFLTPFPIRRPKKPTPLEGRLKVIEYLSASGVSVTNSIKLESNQKTATDRKRITMAISSNYSDIRPFLKWIGDSLRPIKEKYFKKGYDFTGQFEIKNQKQQEIIMAMGFKLKENQIQKIIYDSEWHYLRGGWLEERVFLALRNNLPPDSDIQLGVTCKDRNGNPNEFDVLVTKNNVLYLLECKSLDTPEENVTEYLYKYGALRHQFGITPKVFLVTTSETILGPNGQLKPYLIERASQFNTEIIPLSNIADIEEFFKDKFNNQKIQ